MSQEIHIYGGRVRRGSLTLVPMSKEAQDLIGTSNFTAFLKEFPEIKYSTEWGDWDKSNSAYIANKIANFAGGGDSIPGKLVRMLAGDHYHPPILTDKWTQLSATLADGAYIELDLSLMAYPIINNNTHVEGLRRDSENLAEVVGESTSMFKWLQLGRKCLMPKEVFSLNMIKENIEGIWQEWSKTENGKRTLSDRGERVLNGVRDLGSGIWNLDAKKALTGAETAFQTIVGTNTDKIGIRIGSSFGVIIRDTDNKPLLNTVDKTIVPLDFFITSMKFKFSPHVVRIMENKNRVGCCPEYCEISLTLKSVCKVLPEQIIKMCKY